MTMRRSKILTIAGISLLLLLAAAWPPVQATAAPSEATAIVRSAPTPAMSIPDAKPIWGYYPMGYGQPFHVTNPYGEGLYVVVWEGVPDYVWYKYDGWRFYYWLGDLKGGADLSLYDSAGNSFGNSATINYDANGVPRLRLDHDVGFKPE
jgi:hypothetical protein